MDRVFRINMIEKAFIKNPTRGGIPPIERTFNPKINFSSVPSSLEEIFFRELILKKLRNQQV